MGERDGLVPITSFKDSELWSDEQKNALVRQTNQYLEGKNIFIDKKTFALGSEVISDALRRGLGIYNIELVNLGKRSVVKFVKAGLEERERIRVLGREIIYESRADTGDYKGTYAYPNQIFTEAIEEFNNFPLKGDIRASENLCSLREARKAGLVGVSGKVIGYLPGTLIDNARQQLKTDDEKARLVKNAIVSSVFSKNNSPLVSVDQLMNYFENYSKNGAGFFTVAQLSSMIKELNLEGSQAELLRDLFYQTKGDFEAKKEFLFKNRDDFYSRFSRDLLLLHPALEEEQIILDYEKQDGHTPSVWDKGVCVEANGYKIPTKGILVAALRQAQAAGEKGRITRIDNASRSWNSYENDRIKIPQKIKELRKQVRVEEERVEKLRQNWHNKWEVRSDVVNILNEKQREFGKLSLIYTSFRRQVEDSRSRLSEAAYFLDLAMKSKEKVFQLPRDHYLEIIARRISRSSISINMTNEAIERSGRQLRSYATARNKTEFVNDGVNRITTEAIKGVRFQKNVQTFRELYFSIMTSKDNHIFKQIPPENIEQFKGILNYHLGLLENQSFKVHYHFASVRKSEVKKLLRTVKQKPSDIGVLNMCSRVIMAVTKEYMDKLERQNKALKRAEEKYKESTARRKDLAKNPEKPLGPDSFRSVFWASDYFSERRVCELTPDLGENLSEKATEFAKMRGIRALAPYLPPVVDKEGFKNSLIESFPALEKKIRENEALVEREKEWEATERAKNPSKKLNSVLDMRESNLRIAIENLDLAHNLLENIDSRLFNFDDASGMATKKYVELIARKTILVNRLLELPKLRKRYQELSPEVAALRQEEKILKATRKKALIEEKLEAVLKMSAMDNHIGRMRDLGLAVKVK